MQQLYNHLRRQMCTFLDMQWDRSLIPTLSYQENALPPAYAPKAIVAIEFSLKIQYPGKKVEYIFIKSTEQLLVLFHVSCRVGIIDIVTPLSACFILPCGLMNSCYSLRKEERSTLLSFAPHHNQPLQSIYLL